MNELAPELSIVIAVCNAARPLDETLGGFPVRAPFCYEVVIQDAMSGDATEQVILDHAQLPISYERARDCGIYDAWNKALLRMRGKWAIFLGAGDGLDWSALSRCVSELRLLPDSVEYYATPVQLATPSGAVLELMRPSATPRRDLPQGMSLPHPGLFHRGTLFSAHQFDAACRIAGDYDFLCRTLHENNIRLGSMPFASMLTGGVSGNMDSMFASERELLRLSRKYFPTSVPLKPLLRLTRSGGYLAVRWLCGARVAGHVADMPRIAQGKPRLWSLPEQKPLVGLPPMPEQPSIDLLIATIGRKGELDRLLTSLEGQTYKNFHIFLADQNPSGYLDDMLARYSGLPITRIMLSPQGVSVARNALLEQSKADIIVFPDDDCWYASDTLERVCEAFAAYPSCGALLGVWTSSPDIYASGMPRGVVSRAGLFQLAGTCVQFYRRKPITGIRFDPLLGPGTGLPYGCGEDTDYLLYVHTRTEVRRYAKIRVFHPSPKENQPSPQRVASYAAGRMYLLKKHKFSRLFMLLNVMYPLCVAPLDALRHGKAQGAYRLRMFFECLRNWR